MSLHIGLNLLNTDTVYFPSDILVLLFFVHCSLYVKQYNKLFILPQGPLMFIIFLDVSLIDHSA